MTYQIEVKGEHIHLGQKKHCTLCPVARAIASHFTNLTYVSVYPSQSMNTWFATVGDKDDRRLEYQLPKEVGYFIDAFDNGREVKPFTFQLGV